MTDSNCSTPTVRSSILRVAELLSHAGGLKSYRHEATRAEVVAGLRAWVERVESLAEKLESDIRSTVGPDADAVVLGAELRRRSPRVALGPKAGPGPDSAPTSLLLRMVRSKQAPAPTVWLLGRLTPEGIAIYEQYGKGSPSKPAPVTFQDVKGTWLRKHGGVWQRLTYASPGAKTFEVCLFWYGKESVSVASNPGSWRAEPWVVDGERIGTKFCATFEFSNLSGATVTVTVTVRGKGSHTFVLRVDNPRAQGRDDGDTVPEPIITPTDPEDPPEGPGPIIMPGDLAAPIPGVDPPDLERILELFERFRQDVERALPSVVRDTLIHEGRLESSASIDHVLAAAADGLIVP